MDSMIVGLVQQVFVVAAAALGSGVVVMLATQALKWKAISYPAEKIPVPTAIALSIVASAFSVWVLNMVILQTFAGWLVFTVATLLVATQSYDLVWKVVDQVKALRQ